MARQIETVSLLEGYFKAEPAHEVITEGGAHVRINAESNIEGESGCNWGSRTAVAGGRLCMPHIGLIESVFGAWLEPSTVVLLYQNIIRVLYLHIHRVSRLESVAHTRMVVSTLSNTLG